MTTIEEGFTADEVAERSWRRLEQIYGVRIARQISHKNVCRVYDIGEVDGHPAAWHPDPRRRVFDRCCDLNRQLGQRHQRSGRVQRADQLAV